MTTSITEHRPRRLFRVDPSKGVAKVIGDEVQQRGYCHLTKRQIAERARVGLCAVEVQLRLMAEHGMLVVDRVRRAQNARWSPPNTIRITSPTWLSLLGR